MSNSESECIILKAYNLAEADRIVVFISREHGVLRGVAKGVKRLKSKFGSSLEPFSVVTMSYRLKEERELVSIEYAELMHSYFAEAAEPQFLSTFSYAGDLILQMTAPNDPSENLFRMFKACLESGAETDGSLAPLRLYMELWLLRLSGYSPDWTSCESCRRAFGSTDPAFLRGDLAINCAACKRTSGSVIIEPSVRRLFADALRLSPRDFMSDLRNSEPEVEQLSMLMRRSISQIVGRDIVLPNSTEGLIRSNAV
ncbi:MAG: DNA repair protein RecO [Acidobacteriota bacterium]